ncbi:MAG: gliding motility-associated ABC transporter substrate-binding protein GldG [Bacteroidales bacterium]|jgi:ABC-2 type transport system permease protein|nr:gliding motility-associated ABC transporter substrate-binding protein GldG [Bacteroidales bacterium]
MYHLLKKEISSFFSTLSGYLIIVLFLVAVALFLFVFPTSFNLFDCGYVSMDGFFRFLPLIFLFFIPAISMRAVSEEFRNATIDIIRTKPIRNESIILAKTLALFIILLIALLPCTLFFICIAKMSLTSNALDIGSIFGASVGAVLIGLCFISFGIFSSTISKNQIISFITAVILSGFFYYGFDLIAAFFGQHENFISDLGLSEHYISISRGVIDLRDIVYFISVIFSFLILSIIVFEIKVMDFKGKKITKNVILLAIIILLNIGVNFWSFRIDCSSDKRFSLNKFSIEMLKKVNTKIDFNIYLTGKLPAGMKRLENAAVDLLEELNAYNKKIRHHLVDLNDFSGKIKDSLVNDLLYLGAKPIDLNVKSADGTTSRQLIFPVALLERNNEVVMVELFESQVGLSQEDLLNTSIENLEYQFVSAIQRLLQTNYKKVAFIEGHNELPPQNTLDAAYTLSNFYDIYRVDMQREGYLCLFDTTFNDIQLLFNCIIIAQPQNKFSNFDKWAIDQYIMRGGKVLWLVDASNASLDSLRKYNHQTAISENTDIQELLFKYGARINNDLLLDLNAANIPLVVGYAGNQPQTEFFPFYFLPVIISKDEHIIVKNVNPIKSDFISSIDTIENNIKKTILLSTTAYSHKVNLPTYIDFSFLRENIDSRSFNGGNIPVALLLEGEFESPFKNNLAHGLEEINFPTITKSTENQMIVISDGDIIKNAYNFNENYPMPLGFDNYSKQTFDNKKLILNCVNYLCDGDKFLQLRAKSLKIRLLDRQKVQQERTKWAAVNCSVPSLIVLLFAVIFLILRQHRRNNSCRFGT